MHAGARTSPESGQSPAGAWTTQPNSRGDRSPSSAARSARPQPEIVLLALAVGSSDFGTLTTREKLTSAARSARPQPEIVLLALAVGSSDFGTLTTREKLTSAGMSGSGLSAGRLMGDGVGDIP